MYFQATAAVLDIILYTGFFDNSMFLNVNIMISHISFWVKLPEGGPWPPSGSFSLHES